MKRLMRPIITIMLGLVLALFSPALTYSASSVTQVNSATSALLLQATKTPKTHGVSEVGSTDGIIIMGFVIALIIVIPIFLQRKSWIEPH